MINPINTLRRIQSRIGKPIRPIVELQKNGSIVNVITRTVQEGNVIMDTHHTEAWELHPEDKSSAIYIDGIFKGMGFFVGEEGQVLQIKKDVALQREIETKDKEGKITKILIDDICAAYKGLYGKLIDAAIIERGSALKPSMGQTMVYCLCAGLVGLMIGMSWT